MPNRTQLGIEDPGASGPPAPSARRVFFCAPRGTGARQAASVTILAITDTMTQALSRRLKQAHFANPQQEAALSLAVAASSLSDMMNEICRKHDLTRPPYNVLRILREGIRVARSRNAMIERAPDHHPAGRPPTGQRPGPQRPRRRGPAAGDYPHHRQATQIDAGHAARAGRSGQRSPPQTQ